MKYTFTINTDASYHHKKEVAAWACWIKSSHYLIKKAELFEEFPANSSTAEALAIENALAALDDLISAEEFLQHQRDTVGIKLYINTDSMWTIQAIRGNVKRSKHLAIAHRVKSLADRYEIDIRHVKAHTDKDDARSWVNDWCDKQAKRLVWEGIKKRYGGTKKVRNTTKPRR